MKRFVCILAMVGLLGTVSCVTVSKVVTPQNLSTASVVLKGIQVVYGTICALAIQKPNPTMMAVLVKTDKSLAALGQIVFDNQVPSNMSVAQAIAMGMEALVEITNIIAQ